MKKISLILGSFTLDLTTGKDKKLGTDILLWKIWFNKHYELEIRMHLHRYTFPTIEYKIQEIKYLLKNKLY